MSTRLELGVARALARLISSRGKTVTYTRSATSVSVSAVEGSQLFRLTGVEDVASVSRSDADMIFKVPDLTGGGISMPPARGDTVTIGSRSYFARTPTGEECYRYCDPGQTMVRVHLMESS